MSNIYRLCCNARNAIMKMEVASRKLKSEDRDFFRNYMYAINITVMKFREARRRNRTLILCPSSSKLSTMFVSERKKEVQRSTTAPNVIRLEWRSPAQSHDVKQRIVRSERKALATSLTV